MILMLCACGSTPAPAPVETPAAVEAAAAEPAEPADPEPVADEEFAPSEEETGETEMEEVPEENARTEPFYVKFNGVILTPGQVYDAEKLPEPIDIEETPDCRDDSIILHVYYDEVTFAVKTDAEGNSILNTITIESPMLQTLERITLGCDRSEVEEAYGTDYEEAFGSFIYTAAGTALSIVYNDSNQVTYLVISAG